MVLFALALVTGGALAARIPGKQPAPQRSQPQSIHLLPLPFLSATIHFLAIYRWSGAIREVLILSSGALLLVFLGSNYRLPFVRLLLLGSLLNFAPIALNGGFMPISPEVVAQMAPGSSPLEWAVGLTRTGSKDIVLPPNQALLWFFGDVFSINGLGPLSTAFSIGDVCILFGFIAGI